jgi:hypothetical protein
MLNKENIFHSKFSKFFPFINQANLPELNELQANEIHLRTPSGGIITGGGKAAIILLLQFLRDL